MTKRKSIFVTTSKHHFKDTALALLRDQIQQRTLAGSPVIGTGVDGTTATGTSGPVSTTLPEAPTYYTVDGVEIFDDEGNRWGVITNGIPMGDNTAKTDIQINAVLARVDATTWQLPTNAQYVMDVWFDNLKAEPTNHYTFQAPNTISTVATLGAQVIVTALYLNVFETI